MIGQWREKNYTTTFLCADNIILKEIKQKPKVLTETN